MQKLVSLTYGSWKLCKLRYHDVDLVAGFSSVGFESEAAEAMDVPTIQHCLYLFVLFYSMDRLLIASHLLVVS
jgi:hypothetical protein